MCQPKPGPRCASHARKDLRAARAARDAADAPYQEAAADRDRIEAELGRSAPEWRTAVDRTHALAGPRAEASRAYEEALREYETTPEGQKALAEAVERLKAEGDKVGSRAAGQRLEEARTLREKRVADLAAATAHQQRLANATPAEIEAIAQADVVVAETAARLSAAEAAFQDAVAHSEATRPAHQAASDETRAADAARKAAKQEVDDATAAARNEARRLYTEAGVDERMASFYSLDTVEASRGPSPGMRTIARRNFFQSDRQYAIPGDMAQPLTLKVKSSGPDRENTLAARAAAESDPALAAANTRLTEAIAVHAAAAAHHAALRPTNWPATQAHWDANNDRDSKERRIAPLQAEQDRAIEAADKIRAQIGAGAGLIATPLNPRHVENEVVRNPDDTTNAYLYRPPSSGFPHGRYAQMTEMTRIPRARTDPRGMAFNDGTVLPVRRPFGQRTDPPIIVVPPAAGAQPIRNPVSA